MTDETIEVDLMEPACDRVGRDGPSGLEKCPRCGANGFDKCGDPAAFDAQMDLPPRIVLRQRTGEKIRIPSPEGLVSDIQRLTDALAKASSGRWYRTHGVVVAMGGDAVALTDPDTLNRFGVDPHKGDPTRDGANARLICDAHNSLPSLLEVLRLLLDVPEARDCLERARAEWLALRHNSQELETRRAIEG